MANVVTPIGTGLAGRRVLVMGHTGFVGSWLVLWLDALGASVSGLALPPDPLGLYQRARLDELVAPSIVGDVGDRSVVDDAVRRCRPDLVVHLAAQPIVLDSYRDPVGTMATNVMGTVHVLEAARRSPTVTATLVVTSDKCYAPSSVPHVENDPLGGDDPYSASKAAAELVAGCYARSFPDTPPLATARAGNIIGGGDVAAGRLVPDFAEAAVAGRPLCLRKPGAVRPWQHVLDCLAGYVLLAERLLAEPPAAAGAWNFGPDPTDVRTVADLVGALGRAWEARSGRPLPPPKVEPVPEPEAAVLLLDSERARRQLGWHPVLPPDAAAAEAAAWYWQAAVDPSFDARLQGGDALMAYWARAAATPAGCGAVA